MGFVIGVSVFVLPGALAGSVGPSVILVYACASLFALSACLVAVQLGCAFPVSAAGYEATRALLGPRAGFLLVWIIVGASAVGVGLIAHGLANYLSTILPLDSGKVATISVLICALINMFGAQASTGMQSIMVVLFLAALLAFVGLGLPEVDPELLVPFMPAGIGALGPAIVTAYFSYAGFFVIIELAGEIDNPAKTLPRAMALSFALVLAVYLMVSLTLVGLVPWRQLGADPAPVVTAARYVLPESWISPLALTAVAAGATSINGILLGYSRDLRALAARGHLPGWALLHVNALPDSAAGVAPMALLAVTATVASDNIPALATQAVLGILTAQLLLGVCLLKLPAAVPGDSPGGRLVLSPFVSRASAWVLIIVSIVAALLVALDSPLQIGVFALFSSAGLLLFHAR